MHRLLTLFLLGMTAIRTLAGEGFVTAGNLRIHYLEQGRGPALVFLHAGYQDDNMWQEQQTHFAKTYRTIAIDLPGQGASTGVDTSLLTADVLRIVLDSLHIERAHLVGISLGGSCALDFALAYPERVSRLVLVSTGLPGAPEAVPLDSLSKELFNASDSVFRTKNISAIAESFTHLWCDGPFREPGQTPIAVRNYVLRTTTAQIGRNVSIWPRFNPDAAAHRLHTLRPKLLIIEGGKDVPYILAIGSYIMAHTPDTRIAKIPFSAHMVNLEEPQQFDALLEIFFALPGR